MGKGVYVCMRGDNVTDAVRLSVMGRQPRSHRGFDESHSSVGELRDHLRSSLRFGYQHYPFEIGDHSLRGSDGIEGWQRAAGHRLPHAALDQCGSQDAFHKSWIIFHVCGGDALSTGYGALQHERVEIGPNRLQDGGEARRARTADTHRAMVGLRVIALITDSTM